MKAAPITLIQQVVKTLSVAVMLVVFSYVEDVTGIAVPIAMEYLLMVV